MSTILVCGSRDLQPAPWVFDALDRHIDNDDLVVSGGACGADEIATRWAMRNAIRRRVYQADWASHGKSAGPMRNHRMLRDEKPDLVLAFPGGRGTAHMVRIARGAGVRVVLVTPEGETE